FQLDDIINFKPDISVLLNITPDHLDRYEYNFNNYINSKFKIISNQNEKDCFVYCLDDTTINKEIKNKNIAPKTYPFSIEKELNAEGAFLNKNNQIIININNDMTTIEYLALQGRHNVYNSMAAGICSKIFNIRKSVIQESLADYKNIEHRLESVANIVGIEFINDSKATNVNAAWWALETMHKPVIWIAGGLDKGNDYDSLKSIVAKKVKALICLGIDNTKLKMNFNDTINNISETNNMEDAVKMAYRLAKPGYVVLLCPACASFDLFIDYEDRGKQFKKAVRNL
ncbi:MAG: UDP-N-acetylmuramoyl-L-alanine--D-glutamate ligase, partial [Bacteroidales bacterium]|nr:UDP-N-acetylmuramoyl-L-alanine--D-glutamate ligase [Bacteroidales bacterium]